MREGWGFKTLEELGTLTSSKRIYKSEYVSEGVPFYRSKEIKELGNGENVSLELFITNLRYSKIKKQFGVPKKGDILLTAVGTIGEMYVVDESHDFYFKDGNIMWLKNFNSLNAYFLKYTLTLFVEQLKAMSQGSAYSALTIEKLKKYSIPVPPLQEQQQIVAILDEAFTAIDQAKANIEKNIENAKELFQSKLNDIFSQKGDGWEETTLGDVAKYDKTKYSGSQKPYVGLEKIESNAGLYLGNLEAQKVKSSTFQFDERHVLYGRLRPYLNKVLIPNFKGHCSTEIFPILTSDKLEREYLFYWLMCPTTVSKIDATWTGARMPRANMNEVIKFKLPLPSNDIQKKVSLNLTELKVESVNLESIFQMKLENLDELKKSILQKAFAGALTNKSIAV